MSLQAFIAVVCCPAIKGAARRAAFQIANAHNNKTEVAWLGYPLMAGREGVSTKTMETGVKQLERQGFVVVVRHRGRSNHYRLNITKMEALAFVPEWKREGQNMASVQNTIGVAKNSSGSTEVVFSKVQKPTSAKSLLNRINNQAIEGIFDADAEHKGRLRKDWARDLAHYRNRLNEGVAKPFWPLNAGPKPDSNLCIAPRDLMQRWGFKEATRPQETNEGDGS